MISQVSPLATLTLVLGGQRSGKSAYAEHLFTDGGVYLATAHADARDEEMAQRIKTHRERRSEGWITLEEPRDIVQALKLHNDKPVLMDSLGMWVANMLHAGQSPADEAEVMIESMTNRRAPVVVVSEEVGLGTVPMNPVARSFVDALGLINQTMAARAARVVLVCAGLPLILKEEQDT